MLLRIREGGLATEATKAIIDFCFTYTELQRIWTDVDVRNTSSWTVLEKRGFTREGLIRQGRMVQTWCDYYIYGLLKTDLVKNDGREAKSETQKRQVE